MRFAVVILLSSTTVCFADEKSCYQAAYVDYLKQAQAIRVQNGLTPSAEGLIAARRLEEQYCLGAAGCLTPPQSLAFVTEFERCLDDEAEENLKHRVK
jgi:hypothetical protein